MVNRLRLARFLADGWNSYAEDGFAGAQDFADAGGRAMGDGEPAGGLEEHRKHCKAKDGECPFEKRADETDAELGDSSNGEDKGDRESGGDGDGNGKEANLGKIDIIDSEIDGNEKMMTASVGSPPPPPPPNDGDNDSNNPPPTDPPDDDSGNKNDGSVDGGEGKSLPPDEMWHTAQELHSNKDANKGLKNEIAAIVQGMFPPDEELKFSLQATDDGYVMNINSENGFDEDAADDIGSVVGERFDGADAMADGDSMVRVSIPKKAYDDWQNQRYQDSRGGGIKYNKAAAKNYLDKYSNEQDRSDAKSADPEMGKLFKEHGDANSTEAMGEMAKALSNAADPKKASDSNTYGLNMKG